ncbi:MAG: cytochrome c [Verrucomicrobiota bacterium]
MRIILGTALLLSLMGCGKPSLLREHPPTEDSLYFSGAWTVEGGYLSRSDLAALESFHTLETQIVPGAGVASLGVVPLRALVEWLGFADGGDGVVLECTDRWESFMEWSYILEHDPQLLIYYNGEDPSSGNWPMFGGDIEPLAPFYVFIEGDMSGYVDAPKYGMISATQMSGIRAVNTFERYEPYFEPPMDTLSPLAQEGRALFLQRCSTCHRGPGSVGGNVSERPFIILQTHAMHNPEYLKSVVKDPKVVFPGTIMPRLQAAVSGRSEGRGAW